MEPDRQEPQNPSSTKPNQQSIPQKLLVKVKMLTNQVFEFQINPNITVLDFKRLITQKVNVPVQFQRIVFCGKQLIDANRMFDYVKQDGMTVHLIAKTVNTQPSQSETNQSANTNNSSNQNRNPPNFNSQQQGSPQQNPLGNIMGMMNGLFGNLGQQGNATFTIRSGIGGNDLMGNLGNVLRGMGPIGVPSQFAQSPVMNQGSNPTVNQTSSSQGERRNQVNNNGQYQIPNRGLVNVNSSISRLGLPPQPLLNIPQTPQRELSQYMRRLQHQMGRVSLQLGTGVRLLEEGSHQHLPGFAEMLTSLNQANQIAIEAINRYLELRRNNNSNRNPETNPPQTSNVDIEIQIEENEQGQEQHNQQNERNGNSQVIIDQIIIVEDSQVRDNRGESNQNQPVSGQTQQANNNQGQLRRQVNQQARRDRQQQSNNPTSMPSSSRRQSQQQSHLQRGPIPQQFLTQGMSFNGFNIPPSLMQMMQPALNQALRPQPGNNRQQANMQVPRVQRQLNRQNQDVPQSRPSQNQFQGEHHHQPQIPVTLPNMFQVMGAMNQGGQGQGAMGGMGNILGLKFGDMMFEQGQPDTVYRHILGEITGSDILSMLVGGNYRFIQQKHKLFRAGLLQARKLTNHSQDQLLDKVAKDICKIFIPNPPPSYFANPQQVRGQAHKIVRKHLQKMNKMTLQEQTAQNYSIQMIRTGNLLVGEIVYHLVKNTPQRNQALVFDTIRASFIEMISEYVQGLGGMFYMVVQPNIRKLYEQFKLDVEREESKTSQDIKDQEQLLKVIAETAKNDRQKFVAFTPSELYFPKNKK